MTPRPSSRGRGFGRDTLRRLFGARNRIVSAEGYFTADGHRESARSQRCQPEEGGETREGRTLRGALGDVDMSLRGSLSHLVVVIIRLGEMEREACT